MVRGIMAVSFAIRQSKTILAPFCEACFRIRASLVTKSLFINLLRLCAQIRAREELICLFGHRSGEFVMLRTGHCCNNAIKTPINAMVSPTCLETWEAVSACSNFSRNELTLFFRIQRNGTRKKN